MSHDVADVRGTRTVIMPEVQYRKKLMKITKIKKIVATADLKTYLVRCSKTV
jgi:hypothetical protein